MTPFGLQDILHYNSTAKNIQKCFCPCTNMTIEISSILSKVTLVDLLFRKSKRTTLPGLYENYVCENHKFIEKKELNWCERSACARTFA